MTKDVECINGLNGEEIGVKFYGKELQKTNQEKCRIEKVIKKKGDICQMERLHSSFNSWIDKNDIV